MDGCLSDKKTSKFISNLTSCQLFRVMSGKFHYYWEQGTLKLLRELTMIWGMLKKTPASTESPCVWFAGFLSLFFFSSNDIHLGNVFFKEKSTAQWFQ